MNKISAIHTNKVNSYSSVPFKGSERITQEDKSEKTVGIANHDRAADILGRADLRIIVNKPLNAKRLTAVKFSDGLMRKTSDGSLFSGTLTNNSDAYTKKQVREYKDGRLSRVTKFVPGSDEEKEEIYEFSYPKKGMTSIDIYKYNYVVGDFTLWDKVTITPDIIAKHHIGLIETSDTHLIVKDRKTGKKLSRTNYVREHVFGDAKLNPLYDKEFDYLTEHFRPEERFEYDENGKVKKRTIFSSSLARREFEYDENGKLTSDKRIDKFDRPHKITYYGTITEPILALKRRDDSKPTFYEVEINFLTNQNSDSTAAYEKRKTDEIEVVSTGKVSTINLNFSQYTSNGIATDYMRYQLQNWFWDKNTNQIINIQLPARAGTLLVDPSKTAMNTFNRMSGFLEGETPVPNRDLSEFYKDFDERIRVEQYVEGNGKSQNFYYYVNPETGDLAYFDDERLDAASKEQTNKIYHRLNDIVKHYNKLAKKPAR